MSTIGFSSVLTSLPVTELKKSMYRLESDHSESVMKTLAEKYKNKLGITITSEYQLHIFHIDEIIKWEETKDVIGPFFTSILTQGDGDPLKYIASLLATARVHKNMVVIEVDDKRKLDRISDATLKFAISTETIFID